MVRVYGRPGGAGFLAMYYPRKAEEAAPKAQLLADGKCVKVTLGDRTHWIVLSKEPVTVADGPAKFNNVTAGVIKRWNDGKVRVTLLAAGSAECGKVAVRADKAESKDGAE